MFAGHAGSTSVYFESLTADAERYIHSHFLSSLLPVREAKLYKV
jgi:hypothetical protein